MWGDNEFGQVLPSSAHAGSVYPVPTVSFSFPWHRSARLFASSYSTLVGYGSFAKPPPKPAAMQRSAAPPKQIQLLCITWNVAGTNPPDATMLRQLLCGAGQAIMSADFVAIGLQEVVRSARATDVRVLCARIRSF